MRVDPTQIGIGQDGGLDGALDFRRSQTTQNACEEIELPRRGNGYRHAFALTETGMSGNLLPWGLRRAKDL